MRQEFHNKTGRQYVAVFLSSLFGLGIIGLGERDEPKGEHNGGFYRGVFPGTDQPHNGEDRGDESETLHVGSAEMYANTTSASVTYTLGSLTPIADPYGYKVYWNR
jgi:hypothetical protein